MKNRLSIRALASPSAVTEWERANLGANQYPAILSPVPLIEPCTASHRHLSKSKVSSRLKLPETRQVRRVGGVCNCNGVRWGSPRPGKEELVGCGCTDREGQGRSWAWGAPCGWSCVGGGGSISGAPGRGPGKNTCSYRTG